MVEDAKALDVRVILSDLPVHREQLKGGFFFNPKDPVQLKEWMEYLFENQNEVDIDTSSYKANQLSFGEEFFRFLQSYK